jgi:hypothetical protein
MPIKLLVALVVIAGCHDTHAKPPSNTTTTASFCDAMKSSTDAATDAMHAALVAAGASEHADATTELVAWLHAQACVTSVESDTAPSIRTIKILVKMGNDHNNACTAELVLAVGAQVSMTCKSLIDI